MAGIKHSTTKASGERGYYTEWNADHVITGNVDYNQYSNTDFVIENRTSWPAGPVEGQVIYRTDQHTFYHWNGTRWVSLVGPATVVVAIDGSGDTADIQEGIDMLPAGGGVVYIKEGTYDLTTALTVTINNIALKGAGFATMIRTNTNIRNLICTSVDGIIIEDISFYGMGGANAQNLLVYLNACTNCVINKCKFDNSGAAAILLYNGSRNIVTGNITKNSKTAGIYCNGETKYLIENNICSNNGNFGIYSESTIHDGIIIGNSLIDNITYGMEVRGGRCIISNNYAKGNNGCGINVFIGDYCVLTGNVAMNNGAAYAGIEIYYSNYCTVIGNNCSDDQGAPTQKYGIWLRAWLGVCDKNEVIGNICMNNVTAAIQDDGANNDIAHNMIA